MLICRLRRCSVQRNKNNQHFRNQRFHKIQIRKTPTQKIRQHRQENMNSSLPAAIFQLPTHRARIRLESSNRQKSCRRKMKVVGRLRGQTPATKANRTHNLAERMSKSSATKGSRKKCRRGKRRWSDWTRIRAPHIKSRIWESIRARTVSERLSSKSSRMETCLIGWVRRRCRKLEVAVRSTRKTWAETI